MTVLHGLVMAHADMGLVPRHDMRGVLPHAQAPSGASCVGPAGRLTGPFGSRLALGLQRPRAPEIDPAPFFGRKCAWPTPLPSRERLTLSAQAAFRLEAGESDLLSTRSNADQTTVSVVTGTDNHDAKDFKHATSFFYRLLSLSPLTVPPYSV
jgi:hypothetical protein